MDMEKNKSKLIDLNRRSPGNDGLKFLVTLDSSVKILKLHNDHPSGNRLLSAMSGK
jgi:hypothetical protein